MQSTMADRSLTGHSSAAARRPATGMSQVAPAGPSAPAAHHGATQGRAGAVRGEQKHDGVGMAKNERGNDANMMERGEHEL